MTPENNRDMRDSMTQVIGLLVCNEQAREMRDEGTNKQTHTPLPVISKVEQYTLHFNAATPPNIK